MAERLGRHIKVKYNGAYVAAVKEKSAPFASSDVDVTTDDDGKYRKLLDEGGVDTCDLSVSGIFKATTLLDLIMAGTYIHDLDLEFYSVAGALEFTISGEFRISSFEFSGTNAEAVTFSAEFKSTGEFTKT